MPDLGLGLMIGEADADTHVGPVPSTGFKINAETLSNIRAYAAVAGTIFRESSSNDLYVFDGSYWRIFNDS